MPIQFGRKARKFDGVAYLLIEAANEINTGIMSTHILRLSSSIQQLFFSANYISELQRKYLWMKMTQKFN